MPFVAGLAAVVAPLVAADAAVVAAPIGPAIEGDDAAVVVFGAVAASVAAGALVGAALLPQAASTALAAMVAAPLNPVRKIVRRAYVRVPCVVPVVCVMLDAFL